MYCGYRVYSESSFQTATLILGQL